MHNPLQNHTTHDELVAHRQLFGKYQEFIPEFVYGGIDGAVTTFAVVAASAGAGLSPSIVLIMGISNMLADGLSMSIGSFLSTKSDQERYEKIYAEEQAEIKKFPQDEIKEIREIYRKKGFKGDLLKQIVTHITDDETLWVKEMMVGEHGLLPEDKDPRANALITFISFCLLGSIPISPYLYALVTGAEIPNAFFIACITTGFAFFVIGYLKGLVNQTNKLKATAETIFLGGIAAGVAYGIGDWIEKLIN